MLVLRTLFCLQFPIETFFGIFLSPVIPTCPVHRIWLIVSRLLHSDLWRTTVSEIKDCHLMLCMHLGHSLGIVGTISYVFNVFVYVSEEINKDVKKQAILDTFTLVLNGNACICPNTTFELTKCDTCL